MYTPKKNVSLFFKVDDQSNFDISKVSAAYVDLATPINDLKIQTYSLKPLIIKLTFIPTDYNQQFTIRVSYSEGLVNDIDCIFKLNVNTASYDFSHPSYFNFDTEFIPIKLMN